MLKHKFLTGYILYLLQTSYLTCFRQKSVFVISDKTIESLAKIEEGTELSKTRIARTLNGCCFLGKRTFSIYSENIVYKKFWALGHKFCF